MYVFTDLKLVLYSTQDYLLWGHRNVHVSALFVHIVIYIFVRKCVRCVFSKRLSRPLNCFFVAPVAFDFNFKRFFQRKCEYVKQ